MARPNYIRVFMVSAAVIAAVLVAVVMIYGTASAQVSTGNTITVSTISDDPRGVNDCTLREAIQAANTNSVVDQCDAGSNAGEDTIVFADGLTGEVLLNSQVPNQPPLTITDPKGLVIDGRTNAIVVSGNTTVGIFGVNSGAQLTLQNLTLVDGNASQGGGVANNGTLSVTNSTFTGNRADDGGGIFNAGTGTLTITNSTFSQNTTGLRGGGIYSVGQLRVTDTTFSGNSASLGGAISSPDNQGTGEVTGSTFSGNSADDQGGAIENKGALSVVNSTFSGNSAGAGGGIANGGTATTIGGNTFTAELFLTNDTFSGNSASLNNGGGDIISFNLGSVKSTNTILARSPASDNCSGTVNDGGYNISSDASCAFSRTTSKNSTNPKLATTLANNGGPTQTIKLLKGSPALNAIPNGTNGCGTTIKTDQRGVKRPQGSGCDIGAFEKKKRR